ncbi:hypothetical protein E2C01_018369 [Portunus trituberculatus]|uniref:Uncharacterized protein n=1 Tax=Portunus trituberculatus TaxID=210409 RepID=A0A5B7DW76_PORTR|nr:hypothetical protein [Portunus trituberculatus]
MTTEQALTSGMMLLLLLLPPPLPPPQPPPPLPPLLVPPQRQGCSGWRGPTDQPQPFILAADPCRLQWFSVEVNFSFNVLKIKVECVAWSVFSRWREQGRLEGGCHAPSTRWQPRLHPTIDCTADDPVAVAAATIAAIGVWGPPSSVPHVQYQGRHPWGAASSLLLSGRRDGPSD